MDDAYKAAQNADALVILTEWNEFRALDLKRLARRMTFPALADLRNIYTARDARRAGFQRYVSVGRADYVSDMPAGMDGESEPEPADME